MRPGAGHGEDSQTETETESESISQATSEMEDMELLTGIPGARLAQPRAPVEPFLMVPHQMARTEWFVGFLLGRIRRHCMVEMSWLVTQLEQHIALSNEQSQLGFGCTAGGGGADKMAVCGVSGPMGRGGIGGVSNRAGPTQGSTQASSRRPPTECALSERQLDACETLTCNKLGALVNVLAELLNAEKALRARGAQATSSGGHTAQKAPGGTGGTGGAAGPGGARGAAGSGVAKGAGGAGGKQRSGSNRDSHLVTMLILQTLQHFYQLLFAFISYVRTLLASSLARSILFPVLFLLEAYFPEILASDAKSWKHLDIIHLR